MECKECKIDKPLTIEFFTLGKNIRNGKEFPYWYKKCNLCDLDRKIKKSHKYKSKNRKKISDKQKEYYSSHKDDSSKYHRKYYEDNKNYVKQRVKNNMYNRRKIDPAFRLKQSISSNIRACIKKNHQPLQKYLSYTIHELKQHLESQFESWMTWENYGCYHIKTWKDDDQNTWTWQVDHIIPHSTFKYTSMEDEEFKKCWALNNLRPYSAKQNIIDGNRK